MSEYRERMARELFAWAQQHGGWWTSTDARAGLGSGWTLDDVGIAAQHLINEGKLEHRSKRRGQPGWTFHYRVAAP